METTTEEQRRRPSTSPAIVSFLVFAAITALAAVLGSIATNSSVDSEWFTTLEKPAFYPPGALFGIAWTVLYTLVAVAGWLAWRGGGGIRTIIPWTLQILLNLGWTVAFFGAREPVWALIVIVALLAASIWTAYAMSPYSRTASWLFVPYIGWIGFAAVLNASIVALN